MRSNVHICTSLQRDQLTEERSQLCYCLLPNKQSRTETPRGGSAKSLVERVRVARTCGCSWNAWIGNDCCARPTMA